MTPWEKEAEMVRDYIARHPDEKDSGYIWEAAYIANGLDSDGIAYESTEVAEYEWMYYVELEDPSSTTICVYEGQVYVGTVADVKAKINQAYAIKAGKVICTCCGSFEDKRIAPADCESCGNLVDASEMKDDETLAREFQEALTNCEEVEDGDYEHIWVCNTKLPTHSTPSRHTFLFARIMYMEEHERNPKYRFYGEIIAVNPGMAGKKILQGLLDSYGENAPDLDEISLQDQALMLMRDGIHAVLDAVSSNSKVDCLRKLNHLLQGMHTIGGFRLDAAQNALGSTGWDFMKGDVLAGLKKGPMTPQKEMMKRMMEQ